VGRQDRLLASGLLLGLALATPAPAQEPGPGGPPALPPGDEGPLENDCFLPASAEAAAALIRGDDALERSRAAPAADRDRLRTEAFEAWQDALVAGGPEASVWAEPQDAPRRRLTVGVHGAVTARLAALAPADRSAWRTRFEGPAAAELAAAGGDAAALAAVESAYPLTLAAARAALVLHDTALEEGRAGRARAWLRRAAASAGTPEDDVPAGLAGALAARRAAPGRAPRVEAEPAAWERAREIEALSGVALELARDVRLDPRRLPRTNAGARPGLVFLSPTELAVQTPRTVHLVTLDAEGALTKRSVFRPGELVEGLHVVFEPRQLNRPPGWPLLPAAAGRDLVLVVGRALYEGQSNALLVVRAPEAPDADRLGILGQRRGPELLWGLVGNERVGADGERSLVPGLEDLVELEFQPGPLVQNELVLVQAREYGGEVESWLLALDRRTGALVWRRFLAGGSDLVPDLGRQGTAFLPRLAGQPLYGSGGRVLVGTHLGAGALVETLDGRPVWTLRNRRRAADAPGWYAHRPLAAPGGALFWAPFDSDHLYTLDPGVVPLGPEPVDAVFARSPLPRDESRVLLGGTGAAVVVQGRSGRERTVSRREGTGADRVDALYLGPGERFPGRGLVGEARVFVCSDRGRYLFDLERDLYLVDYAPLPLPESAAPGGDLFARGDVILALGRDALWSFGVR
jgi:hypothetical protein